MSLVHTIGTQTNESPSPCPLLGTASVARAYSGYLDSLLGKVMSTTFRKYLPLNLPHMSPYPDLAAFALTLTLTFILSVGVKESTRFNNVFTCLNVCVVIFVTFAGLLCSDLSNWSLTEDSFPAQIDGEPTDPDDFGDGGFFPFGLAGTLAGAATCFYGYVGFDAIATRYALHLEYSSFKFLPMTAARRRATRRHPSPSPSASPSSSSSSATSASHLHLR